LRVLGVDAVGATRHDRPVLPLCSSAGEGVTESLVVEFADVTDSVNDGIYVGWVVLSCPSTDPGLVESGATTTTASHQSQASEQNEEAHGYRR
jgi:hypothetical protein